MLYVALQTTMTVDEINEKLKSLGFSDWMSPYKDNDSRAYAMSFGEPYEAPKTLDDFTEDEIRNYLESNY